MLATFSIILSNFLCHLGHEKIADLLLKNGANINVENVDKETPLHVAASEGKFFFEMNSESLSVTANYFIDTCLIKHFT